MIKRPIVFLWTTKGQMTEHLGQMAACQQRLMHGLQEYLGLDVSGVDVAVTRHFEKDEKTH